MSFEQGFSSPEIKTTKNIEIASLQERIKVLRKNVDDLVAKDSNISTGEERYRSKINGKGGQIEAEILEKENEIRTLEKEILIIPKRKEIDNTRGKIKELELKHKAQATGEAGFRDADKSVDPIETDILTQEKKLRALEAEILALKNDKKVEAKTVKTPGVEKALSNDSAKQVDEFVYNGASEGFGGGDRGDNKDGKEENEDNWAYGREDFATITADDLTEKVEAKKTAENLDGISRLTEAGTEKQEEILDSEYIPKDLNVKITESDVFEKGHNGINKKDIEDVKSGVNVIDADFDSEKVRENLPAVIGAENPVNTERVLAIEKIKKEMADVRKEYLEINYNKNKAFDRLRKYFGNKSRPESERGYETDAEIAQARAIYDNKLFDLQELQIAEAREKGATDEELAKLFISFRTEQKIDLAAAHDEVKVEQQKGSFEGLIGEKVINITKWYQKLPLSTKLGVGAVMFAGGLAAGTMGGATVGLMGALVATRRLLGGMTAGVGTRLALEARGQQKDRKNVQADEVRFLEQLKNMSEDEKYKFLSEQIRDVAIKDSENTIDIVRNQDLKQQAAGVAVGTFLASGLAGTLVKSGFGEAAKFFGFGGGNTEDLQNAKLMSSHSAPTPLPGNNYDDIKLNTPVTDQFEHPAGVKPVNFIEDGKIPPQAGATELPVDAHAPTLEKIEVVKEGSSIEGGLNKYLETNHPKMENRGNIAHEMYKDYMKTEIAKMEKDFSGHGAGFEKSPDGVKMAAKIAEYKKMLTTGRVNIQPGAELNITEYNGKPILMGIKGEIKMLHGQVLRIDDNFPPIPNHELPAPSISAGLKDAIDNHNPNISSTLPVENIKVADSIPYNAEHDFQRIETEMDIDSKIATLEKDHVAALDDALRNPAAEGGPSNEQLERLGTKGIKDLQASLDQMRAEDMPWSKDGSIDSLIEKGAGPKQILKSCLNNITAKSDDKVAFWREIKDKPFGEVVFGDNTEGVGKTIVEFQKTVGERYADQVFPKKDISGKMTEKTGAWLARITKLALTVKKQ